MALDPDLYYYNELLEDTVRGREREHDTLSEAFSFTDYKVCSHLINGRKIKQWIGKVVWKLKQSLPICKVFFASVAMSDLQEDEGFEKLLKLYTRSERVLL